MKVQQALVYLAAEPLSANSKCTQYQGNNTYEETAVKLRHLQETDFIPYEGPVDVLLDVFCPICLSQTKMNTPQKRLH